LITAKKEKPKRIWGIVRRRTDFAEEKQKKTEEERNGSAAQGVGILSSIRKKAIRKA